MMHSNVQATKQYPVEVSVGYGEQERNCGIHDSIHCVPKRIPDIIDCNLKKDDQILIVFGTNIPGTAGHRMTIQVHISPSVCSCTIWGN